jgi:hypothetical protein
MGKIHGTYGRDEKHIQNLNVMGRDHLGDSGINGIIILK